MTDEKVTIIEAWILVPIAMVVFVLVIATWVHAYDDGVRDGQLRQFQRMKP